MVRLHDNAGSGNAYKIRLLLTQLGIPFERLEYENSGIERIVVTDTIPLSPGHPDNIVQLSAAQTLADSIRRIFADDSVSEIFAGENQLF